MASPNQLADMVDANKEQLRDRVKPDEFFIHCHWASERALVQFIPPHARTILDVGCGPTGGLLMHVPDMRYVGLDFVHEYLADLRRKNDEIGPWEFARRWWVHSPMETFPFPNESFDIVYSRHALEHSTNLDGTLAEIKRVLKPGGLFLFCVPARVDDTEPTHITRWSGRQWLAAFRSIGKIGFHAHHDYFIDELYGYAEKPGKPRAAWSLQIRRSIKHLLGQGVIPLALMNWLRRIDTVLRRVGM